MSTGTAGDRLRAVAVFLLSAGLIGLELTLVRILAITQWHHFAHFVISTALLGFGISGTILVFARGALMRRHDVASVWLAVAFAVSAYLCTVGAQTLPIDAQLALAHPGAVGPMIAYHALLVVPFLLGATGLGLAVMHAGRRVHAVYGANLVGSGAGGIGAVLLMFVWPTAGVLIASSVAGLAAAVLWAIASGRDAARGRGAGPPRVRGGTGWRWIPIVVGGVALLALARGWPLEMRIDAHKPLARALVLESQSDAERLITVEGPRARIDVFGSPLFHDTLFAGFTARTPPPAQLTIFADGWDVGSVFEIDDPDEAEILDHTLMSVPHRLLDRARVLLLGEAGGANVWLAERWGAESVTVVQGNPRLVEVMTGELSEPSGRVLERPGIRLVASDARLFLEADRRDYDLIQFVAAEGMSVGVSGLMAIHEDYLLTVEGVAAALRRLGPRGMLAVTRQQQDPPRDNVKLLLTFAAALETEGIADPGLHIVQLRNYLAVITMAFRRPIDEAVGQEILGVAETLQLDIEWLPVPDRPAAAPYARISGPAGEATSYYHYAAHEAFSPRREQLIEDWVYDIRPATDDRPYFYSFFRWSSIPLLRSTYDVGWLGRLELGYVAVLAILIEAVVAAGILILLPLLARRRAAGRARGGCLAVAGFFFLLGLAYMTIEMQLIVRFTQLLGDPILSAGGVLSAFLAMSGLGSLSSRRLFRTEARAIGISIAGILAVASGIILALPSLVIAAAGWPLPARLAVTIGIVSPLAFLMGIPFPSGMRRLADAKPGLAPWAWGINGFASVTAPPIGILLATSIGLTWAAVIATGFYLLAALVSMGLPTTKTGSGRPTMTLDR